MYHETADKLYGLVYDTFERRPGDAARTIFGAKSMANEMQFDMMRKISELKKAQTHDAGEALMDALSSDALLAESVGYMTHETSKKFQDIIANAGRK